MTNLLQAHREQIGRRVKAARTDANLTLDNLAGRIGSTRQHLIKLEKGQHAPRAEMLQKIADATGKSPAFFTEADDEEEAQPMTRDEALSVIAESNRMMADLMLRIDAKLDRVAS